MGECTARASTGAGGRGWPLGEALLSATWCWVQWPSVLGAGELALHWGVPGRLHLLWRSAAVLGGGRG